MKRSGGPVGNWKAALFDYDYLKSMPDGSCMYCFTNREVALMLALVDSIAWKTRYFSNAGAEIDTDLIEAWEGDLSEKLMSCIGALRVVNGVLETQDEFGAWSPVPFGTIPTGGGGDVFPPPGPRPTITGQDALCLGAANAANTLKMMHFSVMDSFNATFISITAVTLLGVLASALFAAPSLFVTVPIMVAAVTTLGTLTQSDFTDTIFDELVCILVAHGHNTAGVITFDYGDVLTDVFAKGSSMWLALWYYLQIIQEGGLNLSGATTAIDEYDCLACTTWCKRIDLTAGVTTIFSANNMSYDPSGYAVFAASSPGHYDGYLYLTVDSAWGLTKVRAGTNASCCGSAYGYIWIDSLEHDVGCNPQTVEYAYSFVGGEELRVGVAATCLYSSIQWIELSGDGDNPFGADDC